jgi:hypothetical protein
MDPRRFCEQIMNEDCDFLPHFPFKTILSPLIQLDIRLCLSRGKSLLLACTHLRVLSSCLVIFTFDSFTDYSYTQKMGVEYSSKRWYFSTRPYGVVIQNTLRSCVPLKSYCKESSEYTESGEIIE